MKRLLLLLILFLSVVVVTPMLIGEKGYILISIGDSAIETTVITAIITLASVSYTHLTLPTSDLV